MDEREKKNYYILPAMSKGSTHTPLWGISYHQSKQGNSLSCLHVCIHSHDSSKSHPLLIVSFVDVARNKHREKVIIDNTTYIRNSIYVLVSQANLVVR
jgi:hypothetical protein